MSLGEGLIVPLKVPTDSDETHIQDLSLMLIKSGKLLPRGIFKLHSGPEEDSQVLSGSIERYPAQVHRGVHKVASEGFERVRVFGESDFRAEVVSDSSGLK